MMKSPVSDIWLAVNIRTKEYVFIEYGQTYNQKLYDLITPVSAKEVMELILKETIEDRT